jgi:hypothetical protein
MTESRREILENTTTYLEYKENYRNTPAYQGRKLGAGYSWIIPLSSLNLFNSLDFRLNLSSCVSFQALQPPSGNKLTGQTMVAVACSHCLYRIEAHANQSACFATRAGKVSQQSSRNHRGSRSIGKEKIDWIRNQLIGVLGDDGNVATKVDLMSRYLHEV